MRIAGDITIDDCLRSARVHAALTPPWFALAEPLHYVAVLAVAIVCGTALAAERGAIMCVFCMLLPHLSGWFLDALGRQPALSCYRRHAEIHNLGHAECEREGSDLHFSGSTSDAGIPLSRIRALASVGGTTLLVFGNQSCFIIPRAITAGEVQPFLAEIRRRGLGLCDRPAAASSG
jgi:hypothetical protein